MQRTICLLAMLVCLPLAKAAEPSADLRVTGAIVFKNGLSFVTRGGSLVFAHGRAGFAPAPEALLGTLWITAAGRTIDEVRASKEKHPVVRTASSVASLLELNPGRMVTIRVGEREYTGTLLQGESGNEPAGSVEYYNGTGARPESLLLINVEGKVYAFDRAAIQSAAFAQPPATNAPVPVLQAELSIGSKGADGLVPVTVSYLRGGMSWVPEYSITLLDSERARLTMQAALINDGEDLRDTDVRFAVGFPNFVFSHLPSPLTMQLSLKDFLSRLAGGGSSADRMSNLATQQFANSVTIGGAVNDVTLGGHLGGESEEDLFFYDQPHVTLATGERATYPILTGTVPFRHVYFWEVPAENAGIRSDPSERRPADQVWHSISLTNDGNTPWTTGPALVLSNGKPLAQETLSYTAVGARGNVKLTIATDVAVEHQEVEVARKANDIERFGNRYDAVTIEGTLKVHNFKRTAITLSIEKTIEGSSISLLPKGKVTRRAPLPKAINPSEQLEWEVPLAAAEAKTVKYRYTVWVRD